MRGVLFRLRGISSCARREAGSEARRSKGTALRGAVAALGGEGPLGARADMRGGACAPTCSDRRRGLWALGSADPCRHVTGDARAVTAPRRRWPMLAPSGLGVRSPLDGMSCGDTASGCSTLWLTRSCCRSDVTAALLRGVCTSSRGAVGACSFGVGAMLDTDVRTGAPRADSAGTGVSGESCDCCGTACRNMLCSAAAFLAGAAAAAPARAGLSSRAGGSGEGLLLSPARARESASAAYALSSLELLSPGCCGATGWLRTSEGGVSDGEAEVVMAAGAVATAALTGVAFSCSPVAANKPSCDLRRERSRSVGTFLTSPSGEERRPEAGAALSSPCSDARPRAENSARMPPPRLRRAVREPFSDRAGEGAAPVHAAVLDTSSGLLSGPRMVVVSLIRAFGVRNTQLSSGRGGLDRGVAVAVEARAAADDWPERPGGEAQEAARSRRAEGRGEGAVWTALVRSVSCAAAPDATGCASREAYNPTRPRQQHARADRSNAGPPVRVSDAICTRHNSTLLLHDVRRTAAHLLHAV